MGGKSAKDIHVSVFSSKQEVKKFESTKTTTPDTIFSFFLLLYPYSLTSIHETLRKEQLWVAPIIQKDHKSSIADLSSKSTLDVGIFL